MMQTIPTFVYLIPVLILFGLGVVPGILATVVFAVPAPIRLTYLGIRQVPTALIEAGQSFGCTGWQLLLKVKLPAALPTIMAGITSASCCRCRWSSSRRWSGAGGLGEPVVRALQSVNIAAGHRGRARHRHRRDHSGSHVETARRRSGIGDGP